MSKNVHSSATIPSPSWKRLLEEYPDHTALKGPTVIALPPVLLERIQEIDANFFSAEELHFEQRLASRGCTGYFEGVEFTYSILETPRLQRGSKAASPYQGLQKRSAANLLERSPSSPFEIQSELARRRRAFAAWLVTHPQFRKDLQSFQSRWGVRWKGQLQSKRTAAGLMNSQTQANGRKSAFETAYLRFCSEHSLESLAAGFLPVPSDSPMLVEDSSEANLLPMSGVLVFVPWHLLREDTIALRDIVFGFGRTLLPQLLREWIGDESNFGILRYEAMLYLYLYRQLAIAPRYPSKLHGKTDVLDGAFGRYLRGFDAGRDKEFSAADSIKKIRLQLSRRLAARTTKEFGHIDDLSRVADLNNLKSQVAEITDHILSTSSTSNPGRSDKRKRRAPR